jgi:hypothetical protein
MYCSTCGAQVPDGASRCTNCGAAVSRPAGFGVPAVHNHTHVHTHTHASMSVGAVICPRCGFQGPTVGYFSQGGHIAAVLVLAALTWFAAGFGGLIYYVMRRDHRSCARCGHTLGKGRDLALAGPHGAALPGSAAAEADLPEEGGGGGWTFGGMMMLAFAAMMMIIALSGEGEAAFFGLFAAGGGAMMLKRARSAREERRQQLLYALQQPVLRLAGQSDGRLTVTQVASTLGWPMRRAEKVLNSLDDGLRVVSDVTNEGVIVYDFRELRHAQQARMTAQEMDALLVPAASPAQPQQLNPPQMHAQPVPAQQPQPVAQPAAQSQPLPHDGTLRM